MGDGRRTMLGSAVSDPNRDQLTEEEWEFARAMEAYRRKFRRPYPACREVLAVLKSLGWRKVEATGELPDPRRHCR